MQAQPHPPAEAGGGGCYHQTRRDKDGGRSMVLESGTMSRESVRRGRGTDGDQRKTGSLAHFFFRFMFSTRSRCIGDCFIVISLKEGGIHLFTSSPPSLSPFLCPAPPCALCPLLVRPIPVQSWVPMAVGTTERLSCLSRSSFLLLQLLQ